MANRRLVYKNDELSVFVSKYSKKEARNILATRNQGNRKLNLPAVRAFTRSMDKGEWDSYGFQAVFGTDGQLKDGQHRLQAYVNSGLKEGDVEWLEFVSSNPDLGTRLDVGRKRSIDDLARMGYGIHGAFGSISNCVLKLRNGKSKSGFGTETEAAVMIGGNYELFARSKALGALLRKSFGAIEAKHKPGNSGLAAAVFELVSRGMDVESVSYFYDRVSDSLAGRGPLCGAPFQCAKKLRRAGERMASTRINGGDKTVGIAAIVIAHYLNFAFGIAVPRMGTEAWCREPARREVMKRLDRAAKK